MNKQCFRVIFSKTLQRLVVVSELAKSEGKSTERNDFSISHVVAQLKPLTFSLFCALGFVAFSDSALAETLIIQADKSAPKNQQPIVLQTANGLPQVNIQTPNDKGLSHNKYSQFDVAEKGAILNNSRTNTQTQQAGLIQGNPYLARGEAKVILNEVNSNKPSVMKGYVEVAGKKADVIIANPSGLHCDGCGIINSDRVTFTTGKPEIKNGQVDNFKVEAGKVKVSGKGLDNSRVDYTEILAREAEVNAGIWSKKETKVITGKNTVKRSENDKNLQIINTKQPLAGEAKPQVAIDIGELGGMYSGKIHLIGTEDGVGVRNAGHIGASFDSVVIDASGKIINTQYIGAQKDIVLNAKETVENKGIVYAKQQLNTKAQSLSNQQGTLLADNLIVEAKQVNNQTGKLLANKKITLVADTLQDEGEIISNGDVDVRLKADFQLNNAFQVANNLTFVTEGNFTNQTEQRIGNQFNLTAKQILNPHQKTLSATQTFLNAQQITNRGTLDGSLTVIKSDTLDNLGTGRIYGDDLAIQADRLNNDKEGEHSATIAARKRLDLGVGTLRNRDHSLIFSAGDLFIGGKLNNHFIAEGNAKLIENQSATIEALGNGAIFADRLRNEDRYLTLGIKYDYDKYEVYTPLNTSAKYYGNAGKNGQGWMDWNNDSRRDFNAYFRFNDRTKGSVASRDWVQHIYTQETATTTIEKQDPAKILIGGNLTLNGGTFINDKSRIAVGSTLWIGSQAFNQNPNGNSLNNQGVTLENIDLIGDINRIDRGVRMQINAIRKRHGIGRRVWVHDPVSENYDPIVHPTAHFNFQLELNPIGKNVEKTGTQAEAFTQADQVNLSNMSSLYQINPDAERGYLIETDPRFTDGKQWLSSDYMYQQLRHNFDNVHKRLGDGFFEQRLINEQINQLTGRRYLSGYQNDMAQYQALMNSGLKYAKQFNLALGVALTPQQMAELTTDMVWLVNKEITLADGRKVTALVPQVYLVPRDTHLTAQGALISANKIFAQTDSLQNSGTIAGDEQTVLHANQLENRGTILGDNVDLSAKQTLLNLGGKISAVNSLSLFAGQQLEIASTTSSSELKTEHTDFARTQLDRLASVSVTGAGGTLQLRSDGDITVKAAQISSEGTVDVLAKKGLSIITVHTQNREHYNSNPDNYYRLDQTGEIGSEITGKAGVKLVGLDNAVIRQSEVSSPEGDVFVGSKGKVSIESGKAEETLDSASKMSAKGLFSKTTETLRHHHQTTGSQGSSIDGVNVKVYSEKDDVVIKGSNMVAENALEVEGENVSILAEKNRHYEENDHRKTKSGVMGTGGIGFNAGSKKETTETDNTQESATGSLVGSLQGKTTITARNHYEQKGSSVTSRDNDVDIQAKKVDIAAENLQYESNYTYTMEQKGVTIAVNIPVVQAVQNAINMVKEAQKLGESKNNRINAMAAANSAFEAMRLVDQALGIMKNAQEAQNMAQAANISVSITYGEQKSIQTQTTRGNTGQSSQVQAGGNVSIRAVGDGSNSDITITGSDVMGTKGTSLKADDEVNILAFQQNHQERSENKSSGFNAGVAVSYGSNGLAFGVTAGGNYGKGYGNGDETTWLHSHVGSQTGLTQIESGSTATVKGGQVRGNRVELSAENLNVESVQDTMSYESKQMNAEGQVTVGYGFSASGSYNQSNMKANSATVTEQSGIFAGDGGFDIQVNQHTDLKGAVVTSTAAAEQEGKNHFSTNTLSHQDIQNHSSYSAKGFGLNGGFSVSGGEAPKDIGGVKLQQVGQNHKDGSSKVELGGVAGVGSQGNWGIAKGLATAVLGQIRDSSSENGVTTSAIHTSNITIRDSAAQQQRTGKSTEQIIADINRENIHQSVNKVDIDKVKSEFERDLKTATDFVKNVSDVGDEIYHRIEKSDDVLAIKKGLKKDCEHIDCVSQIDIDVDDLRMPTTKEEAEAMKRMYVHGIFNMDDKDIKEGAIQYGGEDFLNNDVLVIKRQYSSVPAELVFTVFERLRAGVDMPSVFGASNASKAQVKVWELLNEYNKANPNEQVDLTHVAHSLGASGTKNAMNWAKAQGMQFDNTYFDGYVAGTSYPITNKTIAGRLSGGLYDKGYTEKAAGIFGKGHVTHTSAPGDIVATGIGLPFIPGSLGLGIGNTDTTGNNFPRMPGRILTGDHNVAYYRDERVIKFLNPKASNSYEENKKALEIIKYQNKVWGQVGPKTETNSLYE